jgi:hypothetical protein
VLLRLPNYDGEHSLRDLLTSHLTQAVVAKQESLVRYYLRFAHLTLTVSMDKQDDSQKPSCCSIFTLEMKIQNEDLEITSTYT